MNQKPQVALVSGGSRGLGAAVVAQLLEQEWCVATLSRGENDTIRRWRGDYPDTFHWTAADLGEPATLCAAAHEADQRFGGIDLLVNNAAVLGNQQLMLTTPPKELDSMIALNLIAPMILTQTCARVMARRGGGHIITVSSINAVRGYRGVAPYSAAKAGMDAFGRALARELGPLGIRVNSVVPGFFDSDMTAQVSDANRERITRRTPLGRLGNTADVLASILFLVSPESSFVTGQALIVDGGITC